MWEWEFRASPHLLRASGSSPASGIMDSSSPRAAVQRRSHSSIHADDVEQSIAICDGGSSCPELSGNCKRDLPDLFYTTQPQSISNCKRAAIVGGNPGFVIDQLMAHNGYLDLSTLTKFAQVRLKFGNNFSYTVSERCAQQRAQSLVNEWCPEASD